MYIQLIRNATVKVTYGGYKFLIDPFLAKKGMLPPVEMPGVPLKNNPMVELPIGMEEILDVDAVIITHLHFDHFDEEAKHVIPKTMKLFVQSEEDKNILLKDGFTNIDVLSSNGSKFHNITLYKTYGQHGVRDIMKPFFEQGGIPYDACGIVMKHPDEKSLYVVGDTIWCKEVKDSIDKYEPEVAILNAGCAQGPQNNPIIMGKEDVYEFHKYTPNTELVAVHLEVVNHAILTRKELQAFVKEKGFDKLLCIPNDGESLEYKK